MAEGRAFLHDTLIPLDRVLPLLVLTATGLGSVWLTRPHKSWGVAGEGRLRYMLLAVPILYAVADIGENWAFDVMLRE